MGTKIDSDSSKTSSLLPAHNLGKLDGERCADNLIEICAASENVPEEMYDRSRIRMLCLIEESKIARTFKSVRNVDLTKHYVSNTAAFNLSGSCSVLPQVVSVPQAISEPDPKPSSEETAQQLQTLLVGTTLLAATYLTYKVIRGTPFGPWGIGISLALPL